MDLSHLDEEGQVHMVDITEKETSSRRARVSAAIQFPNGLLSQLLDTGVEKGNLWTTARLAGIQAAKKTPALIPLAHPINLSHVEIKMNPVREQDKLVIICEARARDATGVEMEALTGASVAALTIYDMCKSEHKGIKIIDVHLLEKEGGKSGHWKSNE